MKKKLGRPSNYTDPHYIEKIYYSCECNYKLMSVILSMSREGIRLMMRNMSLDKKLPNKFPYRYNITEIEFKKLWDKYDHNYSLIAKELRMKWSSLNDMLKRLNLLEKYPPLTYYEISKIRSTPIVSENVIKKLWNKYNGNYSDIARDLNLGIMTFHRMMKRSEYYEKYPTYKQHNK